MKIRLKIQPPGILILIDHFLIQCSKPMPKIQLVYYLCEEVIGALFGSLFANLGANAPNYSFPVIF